jgi:teichoic acid transport system ATP-binding protein
MSYNQVMVKVENVSKVYRIYDNPKDRLKQFFFKKQYYREHYSLKNISFEVEKGRTLGIIGKNGSGKSTLLQIVANTLQPSSGSVTVNGKVAALLELGSGFNPEFTGKENVYLQGSIMGLSSKEIDERYREIVEFADIGDFINQPVKVYSSGMFVRLAFACAVNVDPDILIIDEALSVGDLQFQLKCMDKMKSFKNAGKTILFVSHDTYAIKNFCDEVIWMKDGEIFMRGEVQRIVELYEDYMKKDIIQQNSPVPETTTIDQDTVLTIDKVEFFDESGNKRNEFRFGEKITVCVDYTLYKEMEGVVGGVAVISNRDAYVCGLNTKIDRYPLPSAPGKYQLICKYDNLELLPGSYFVDVGFFDSSAIVRLDYKTKISSFYISSEQYRAEGIAYLRHTWEVRDNRLEV